LASIVNDAIKAMEITHDERAKDLYRSQVPKVEAKDKDAMAPRRKILLHGEARCSISRKTARGKHDCATSKQLEATLKTDLDASSSYYTNPSGQQAARLRSLVEVKLCTGLT